MFLVVHAPPRLIPGDPCVADEFLLQLGELRHAVQGAYTFLVQNPTHKDTLDGLKFYMEQQNYNDDMLVDLMRRPYEVGHRAYPRLYDIRRAACHFESC